MLALAAMVVGCGAAEEDRLIGEKIVLMDQIADTWDKVQDKKSFPPVLEEVKPLMVKLRELDKKLEPMGTDRIEAAIKKHAIEHERARKRMEAAKDKAKKISKGEPPS